MSVVEENKSCPYYKKLDKCKVVSTIYFGDFYLSSFMETYINLLVWAKENGYKLSNKCIEEWLISPLDTNHPEHWITKIMVPLAD